MPTLPFRVCARVGLPFLTQALIRIICLCCETFSKIIECRLMFPTLHTPEDEVITWKHHVV